MKAWVFLFLFIQPIFLPAQRPSRQDSSFYLAMDSVLLDFPNNFHGITGDTILLEGETDHFNSSVQLPGSSQCQITRYHSSDDTTASWQALMFRSDDFEKAAGRYHALHKQLTKCFLILKDGSVAYLDGKWNAPTQDLTFSVSTLKLSTKSYWYKKMEVELELLYQLGEWVVNINVVSKEKDSENWIR